MQEIWDTGSIPGLGRSLGVGSSNPLQYSHLVNSMDRVAWWATVHGIAKSWTQLSDWAQHRCPEQNCRAPERIHTLLLNPWASVLGHHPFFYFFSILSPSLPKPLPFPESISNIRQKETSRVLFMSLLKKHLCSSSSSQNNILRRFWDTFYSLRTGTNDDGSSLL